MEPLAPEEIEVAFVHWKAAGWLRYNSRRLLLENRSALRLLKVAAMLRFALLTVLVTLLGAGFARAQCDPDLNPLDDGSGAFGAVGLPAVVISEINPGNYIELFNTTASDFNTTGYWFCSPFTYTQVGAVIVPAGGYATVVWPGAFIDTDAGGEIQLFKSGNFGASTDILDFVCWGTNPHGTRVAQANAVGKWSGVCAPVLANGAIHRVVGTKGTSSADYDVTSAPSPSNCVPTGVTPQLPIARLTSFPNPFSASTQIDVSLTEPATVDLAVYSVDGARVRTLGRRDLPAGTSRITWDGRSDAGHRVPSGVYLVRLDGNASAVARVVTLR